MLSNTTLAVEPEVEHEQCYECGNEQSSCSGHHEPCDSCGCEECGNGFDCIGTERPRHWCAACVEAHDQAPCSDNGYFDEWCELCHERHYDFDCEGCGCEVCGHGDCGDCGRCCPESEEGYPSTEHTRGCTDTATFLKLPRSVGLEVELDHGPDSLPSIPAKFGAKGDGSLYADFPAGCEFVTNPGYGAEFEQDVAQLYDNALDAGYETGSQCGLHVHVDASDLDDRRRFYLMALWFAVQRTLYDLYPTRRSGYGGIWPTEPWGRSRQAATRTLLDKAEAGDAFPQWDFNSHNNGLCGPTRYGTFEFRMFGSTDDKHLALAWASLCEHMVHYASNGVKRKSVEGLASTPNGKVKLNALMNLVGVPNAAKRKLNARYDEMNPR